MFVIYIYINISFDICLGIVYIYIYTHFFLGGSINLESDKFSFFKANLPRCVFFFNDHPDCKEISFNKARRKGTSPKLIGR